MKGIDNTYQGNKINENRMKWSLAGAIVVKLAPGPNGFLHIYVGQIDLDFDYLCLTNCSRTGSINSSSQLDKVNGIDDTIQSAPRCTDWLKYAKVAIQSDR